MTVERVVCKLYASNIYVLEDVHADYCWLVDIGEKNFVVPSGKRVKGVFITHTHIDHIQGLNDLLEQCPDCIIYVNEVGREGLFDDKVNLTFYHEEPLCFVGGDVRIVKEGDIIGLFEGVEMEVFETPGHHPSCVCYKDQNYLFTGDSYIPGVSVVTKLKGGNRLEARNSEARIKSMINEYTLLCPGHNINKNYND